MKISFDDDNDLKPLEDMLARALVRAAKTILRDMPGLLATLQAATDPQTPPPPVNGHAAPQAYGQHLERREPHHATPPPPAASRRGRHTLAGKLKCVPDRPDGYIPRSEAAQWLSSQGMNYPEPSISKWILDGSIAAVIVTESTLKPTKGLPGRLHVKREDLKTRNTLRILNMPPRWQGQHGAPAH